MGGGELQLSITGPEDQFLISNPKINFFKKVYMRYTNFSMTPIVEPCYGCTSDLLFDEPISFRTRIPRSGDLIHNVFLRVDIPGLTISSAIKYVKYLGTTLVKSASLYIENTLIETLTGEFLYTYHSLHNSKSKQDIFDYMIGHRKELYENDTNTNTNTNTNTLPKITLSIPLTFWFSRNNGLALPIIALKQHQIYIDITLRPLKDLFVNSSDFGNLITTSIDLNPRLDINYIFLDNYERNLLVKNNQEYLIEQVTYHNVINLNHKRIIEFQLYHPIKEIIILPRKSDAPSRNEWFTFTDNDSDIIKRLGIRFDNKERLEFKHMDYFSKIQAFHHYHGCYNKSVMLYSFSKNPGLFQPKGICNASEIENITFDVEFNDTDPSTKYDLLYHFVHYNILDIRHGMGGLRYANR